MSNGLCLSQETNCEKTCCMHIIMYNKIQKIKSKESPKRENENVASSTVHNHHNSSKIFYMYIANI